MSEIPSGPHRCYRALAVPALLVSATAGLPVPVVVRAASAVMHGHLGQVLPVVLHPNLVHALLAAALVAAGVTSETLLDHLAAHAFAARQPAADDSADPDQPRQAV